jgi:hypothetical protein
LGQYVNNENSYYGLLTHQNVLIERNNGQIGYSFGFEESQDLQKQSCGVDV